MSSCPKCFLPHFSFIPCAFPVPVSRAIVKSMALHGCSCSVSLGIVPTWSPCTSLQGRSCRHIRRTWFSGMPALPRSPLQALPPQTVFQQALLHYILSCSGPYADLLVFQDELFQLLLTCCSTSAVCLYLELDAGIPGLRSHALWPHGILRILMAVRMKELQHKTRPLQWLQLSPSSPFHAVYGCCNIPPACGEGECE